MPKPNPQSGPGWKSLVFGGLLPLVVYTLVEELYGVKWGLVAGMAIGIAEIVFERYQNGKVETITWIGNCLLLGLGGVSLFTQEGVWFRLQPAILEVFMGGLLLVTSWAGKPFLVMMARKQNLFARIPAPLAAVFESSLKGFNDRTAIFLFAHAALATWAALYWSTRAWVILKGVGFTVSFLIYGIIEMYFMRRKVAVDNKKGAAPAERPQS